MAKPANSEHGHRVAGPRAAVAQGIERGDPAHISGAASTADSPSGSDASTVPYVPIGVAHCGWWNILDEVNQRRLTIEGNLLFKRLWESNMRYSDETDEASEVRPSEFWRKLLVPIGLAGHVTFYDLLPAALTWLVGSANGLDLFSAFDNPSLRRLAGMGLFLSAIAAVITTESVTRLARPFSVRHFVATAVLIGAALFPSLADWHRVRLGLAPEQFAVLQSYSYLALRVAVGILIGATVSWILLARYVALSSPRPQYQRK